MVIQQLFDLKEYLLIKRQFVDNEFLDKYCTLVQRNYKTSQRAGCTNKHHIVPRAWFKLNDQPVDNSVSNLVNLQYRDHVLAHYYLALCTENELQYANELALMCLTTRKKFSVVDKHLIQSLPLYNNIYEHCKQRLSSNYRLYKKAKK